MLQIIVPGTELFDESTEMFVHTEDTQLELEHSLLAISKWESKWCKPFLLKDKNDTLTPSEFFDYIKCMTVTSNVSKDVYNALTPQNIKAIIDYIDRPMTATTITDNSKSPFRKEIITSELIYYWMVAYQIPFECETWNIHRLLMLIRICNAKNNPKKMSKREILMQNRALNAARKKALNTKG